MFSYSFDVITVSGGEWAGGLSYQVVASDEDTAFALLSDFVGSDFADADCTGWQASSDTSPSVVVAGVWDWD